MAFWGVNSGKKHCKGAYGFLGSTQWKKALIAHLLPKKPPSRKSHQFEVTLVPQVLMSKQIKDLSPRCLQRDPGADLLLHNSSPTAPASVDCCPSFAGVPSQPELALQWAKFCFSAAPHAPVRSCIGWYEYNGGFLHI